MKHLKHLLATHLTKKLLKHTRLEDILTIVEGQWFVGGRKLSADEKIVLQEEAESFKKSFIWKLICNEIAFTSNRQMFEEAKTENDIIFGKAMLWNIHVMRQFIERVSK